MSIFLELQNKETFFFVGAIYLIFLVGGEIFTLLCQPLVFYGEFFPDEDDKNSNNDDDYDFDDNNVDQNKDNRNKHVLVLSPFLY